MITELKADFKCSHVSYEALFKHLPVFQMIHKEISSKCPLRVTDFRLRPAIRGKKWEHERD